MDVENNAFKKKTPTVKQRIQKLIEIRKQLEFKFKKIQTRIKRHYNLYHKKIPLYKIGIKIFLSARNIRTKKPNKKLDYKFLESFRIVGAVGKQTYRLKFPSAYSRIHDIFNIFLLEFYYNRKNRASIISESILIKNQNEWAVERILAIKKRKNKSKKHLIRWKEFSPVYDS
jgi:hypothetical protein